MRSTVRVVQDFATDLNLNYGIIYDLSIHAPFIWEYAYATRDDDARR